MKNLFILAFLSVFNINTCLGADDHAGALKTVAEKIEALGKTYPQLKEFSVESHIDTEQLKIVYGFSTHRAESRGGWTSGVPNPNPDGIWFYIDFHDPLSIAQIHTQPAETTPHYLGDKKVQFLILEGTETQSVAGEVWKILRSVGMQVGMETARPMNTEIDSD